MCDNCQLSQLPWGRLSLWRLSLFSFSVFLDYFDHPPTHRHLEDLLRGSPHLQQTLLIKSQVPQERHLSWPSVPDRCERKRLRRTFISRTRGSITVGADPQLEFRFETEMNNEHCLFYKSRTTDRKLPAQINDTSPGCTFHRKESFTVTF